MKGFKTIQPRLKVEPITIKEPYKPELKEFDDTDDFTRFFRSNEELFREVSEDPGSVEGVPRLRPGHFLTANKLNRTYKIPGYRIRITRKGTDNEELTLVKDYSGKSTEINETSVDESTNDEMNEKISDLQQQIDRLADQINNIETFLCQLKR